MTGWIKCEKDYTQADVVRWKEPVWGKRPRRGKASKIGERRVSAEVLHLIDGDDWVRLLVRGCDIVSDTPDSRRAPLLLKNGEEIKRKRSTLERGEMERLPWSDESARSIVTSKFRGGRD